MKKKEEAERKISHLFLAYSKLTFYFFDYFIPPSHSLLPPCVMCAIVNQIVKPVKKPKKT